MDLSANTNGGDSTQVKPESFGLTSPRQASVSFRSAWNDERARLNKVFAIAAHDMSSTAQCFVAIRQIPLERLVGAIYWRISQEEGDRSIAQFRWQVLPDLVGSDLERDFLCAFVEKFYTLHSQAILRTADTLPEGSSAQWLVDLGFAKAYQQQNYVLTWQSWCERTRHLLDRRQKHIPAQLRVACPQPNQAEALAAFVKQAGLVSLEDRIREALISIGGKPLFHAHFSAVLTDGDALLGACLVCLDGQVAQIVFLAMAPESKVPMGLACALLFEHCQKNLAEQQMRLVGFRVDAQQHPAVVLMAKRFSSRPLGTFSAYQKIFSPVESSLNENP